MPEQAALSELVLSSSFKRCQRALAQWLEQQSDAHLSVMAARQSLQTLQYGEWMRLMNWLDCLLYAARHNSDLPMAARIERLTASLGRATPGATVETAQAGVAVAMTGQAIPRNPGGRNLVSEANRF